MVRLFRSQLACEVAVLSARQWREDVIVEPRYRFGYRPPERTEPPAVCFSPGLLDEITGWLSDDEFDIYITAIEAFMAAHLMLPGAPPDEIMRLLENELLAEAPLALRLMSEVELRAIDDGLVALT